MPTDDRNDITIILRSGVPRTISLSENGTLFAIGSGVTLALDGNITLEGRSLGGNGNENNNTHLVRVEEGGELIMIAGSNITGNNNISTTGPSYGGAVFVNAGGSFNMLGGEISGNASARAGGAVHNRGTFRISNGIIHGINAEGGLGNIAPGGAALYNYVSDRTEAQRGTFNPAAEFSPLGDVLGSNFTIHATNGRL